MVTRKVIWVDGIQALRVVQSPLLCSAKLRCRRPSPELGTLKVASLGNRLCTSATLPGEVHTRVQVGGRVDEGGAVAWCSTTPHKLAT